MPKPVDNRQEVALPIHRQPHGAIQSNMIAAHMHHQSTHKRNTESRVITIVSDSTFSHCSPGVRASAHKLRISGSSSFFPITVDHKINTPGDCNKRREGTGRNEGTWYHDAWACFPRSWPAEHCSICIGLGNITSANLFVRSDEPPTASRHRRADFQHGSC